jgi:hypothetical protein
MQPQKSKPTHPKNGSNTVKTLRLRLDWPLLPGCISTARSRCGQPRCACKGKPPKLHGPYYRWTGLVAGKPTTITLSPTEARECQRRIKRFRRLQKCLRQLVAKGIRCAPWNQRQD